MWKDQVKQLCHVRKKYILVGGGCERILNRLNQWHHGDMQMLLPGRILMMSMWSLEKMMLGY